MAWFLLALTIVLEVAGTVCMKLSNGFTKVIPSILMFIFYGSCFAVFSYVVAKIELSIAYAIWSGLGTLFVFLIAILVFGESFSLSKAIFVLLIIVGVVGLKVTGAET